MTLAVVPLNTVAFRCPECDGVTVAPAGTACQWCHPIIRIGEQADMFGGDVA